MAKNKKPAKAAKKPVAKTKTAAKPKKSVTAKATKKAPAKKAVKKAAPTSKKVVAKKAVAKKAPAPAKKVVAKKTVASSPRSKVITETKTINPVKPAETPKVPSIAQLTMFQMPTQRPIAHKPAKPGSNSDDRTRYSENELREFETLINGKLGKAKEEYRILKETLNRNNDEGTDATSGGNTKVLEDGAETAEKENLSQLAARQQKYIMNLENALIRIKNGTYGICSVTGKLISKERLIAVPHTTQSIEAKMMQQD
jgi:RNA polymerase-binding transcription factor DksA